MAFPIAIVAGPACAQSGPGLVWRQTAGFGCLLKGDINAFIDVVGRANPSRVDVLKLLSAKPMVVNPAAAMTSFVDNLSTAANVDSIRKSELFVGGVGSVASAPGSACVAPKKRCDDGARPIAGPDRT
jgi:hypothetical protein